MKQFILELENSFAFVKELVDTDPVEIFESNIQISLLGSLSLSHFQAVHMDYAPKLPETSIIPFIIFLYLYYQIHFFRVKIVFIILYLNSYTKIF